MKKLLCFVCLLSLLAAAVSCGCSDDSDFENLTPPSDSDENGQNGQNGDGGEELLGVWEGKTDVIRPDMAVPGTQTAEQDGSTLTLYTNPVNVDISGLKAALSQNSFISQNYYLGEKRAENAREGMGINYNYTYEYSVVGQFKQNYAEQTDTYYSDFSATVYYEPRLYTNGYRVSVSFNGAPLCAATQKNHQSVLKLILGEEIADYLVYGESGGEAFANHECREFEMNRTDDVDGVIFEFCREMDTHYLDNHKRVIYTFGIKKLPDVDYYTNDGYYGDYQSIYHSFANKLDDVLPAEVENTDPFSLSFLREFSDAASGSQLGAHQSDNSHTFTIFICDGYSIYAASFYTPRCEISYSYSLKGGKICGATFFNECTAGTLPDKTKEDAYHMLCDMIALATKGQVGDTPYASLVFGEDDQIEAVKGNMTLFGMKLETEWEIYIHSYEDGPSASYRIWAR